MSATFSNDVNVPPRARRGNRDMVMDRRPRRAKQRRRDAVPVPCPFCQVPVALDAGDAESIGIDRERRQRKREPESECFCPGFLQRSEERRGGKEWVSTCRARGGPYK